MTLPRTSRVPAARTAHAQRPPDGARLPVAALERLGRALRAGDVPQAEQVLGALQAAGLDRVALACEVLHPVTERLLDPAGSELERQRVVLSARAVVHRLRAFTGREGVVALVAVGERDLLGLDLVALALEQHGLLALVAEGLPEDEARQLAAAPGLRVLGLAAASPAGLESAGRLLQQLRPGPPATVLLGPAVRAWPGAAQRAGATACSARPADVVAAVVQWADPLSDRERATLALVAQGLTNAQIGQALGVSTGAVKARLDSAFAKLGATDRASAVALAMRAGSVR